MTTIVMVKQKLSPATYTTVRTQDAQANPFWSHGMTWHADDMLLKGGDSGLESYGSESTTLMVFGHMIWGSVQRRYVQQAHELVICRVMAV